MSQRSCVVPNGSKPCDGAAGPRGMCATHYTRWRRHGDPQSHIPIQRKIPQDGRCSLGCEDPPVARGWCIMHYNRWRLTGDPGPAERIYQKSDPESPHKACSQCGESKPKDEFHREPRIGDGRASACKSCDAVKMRERTLKRKYGISADEYDRMVAKQDGVCWICSQPPGPRGLVVDHCHKTGAVRALLCNNCNALLGMAEDDIPRLLSAIKYLETHRT